VTRRGLRFAGHPLHAALVHFPMGLLPASLGADLLLVFEVEGAWGPMAYWMIVVGLAAGGAAAVAGFLDLLALPPGHPASPTATAHMVAAGSALTLFLGSLLLRGQPPAPPGGWALVLSAAGALALLAAGWLGGHLVYGHGVGTAPAPPRHQP
jgi:uncharacterized membrane protein